MIQDLEQIEYRKGMIEKGMKPADLPVKVWHGARIPAKIREAITRRTCSTLAEFTGIRTLVSRWSTTT